MSLRYLRFQLFKIVGGRFAAAARRRRMTDFVRLASLRPGMRVLDLGGSPSIWVHVRVPLDITILNLPGALERGGKSHHAHHYLEADACDLRQFGDRSFDLVFSNSVIEHVGPEGRQDAFAREVRRLGNAYWIQTPSIWFPVEAHTGMPLWWFYPKALRARLIRGWRRKLPAWTEMVEGTRVLSLPRLHRLFPEGRIRTERSLGFPKSYSIYALNLAARTVGSWPSTSRS